MIIEGNNYEVMTVQHSALIEARRVTAIPNKLPLPSANLLFPLPSDDSRTI